MMIGQVQDFWKGFSEWACNAIGYCYGWIHKSYTLRGVVMLKKCVLNCECRILGAFSQKLEGRFLVFWKEVVGYALSCDFWMKP